MLETPGAFIGEFDALDGPKVTYAFEFFDYGRTVKKNSAVRQLLCYVEGRILLGKAVASGLLHHECKEYLNSVAAHVLTSNESREERLLYQDSGCPCVGSFMFSIPDIVARGEKRRFCLIFIHPSYRELVARWDYLSSFVEVLLGRWTHRVTMRYQHEYDTLKNLEQLREESRRKPLRSLPQLLTEVFPDSSGSDAAFSDSATVFEDFHCSFELMFPQVFSQPAPLCSSEKSAAHQEAERFLDENMLLAQSSIDRLDVDVASLPEDDMLSPRFAKQIVFVDSEIVVKPLPVWLLEYLSDTADEGVSVEAEQAVYWLLRAVFSGNQIIISGDSARDCASLGMALSYMVPPPLVKMHVGSDRYRMPYESRVLSFSQRALTNFVFAESPAASGGVDESRVVKLFDMESDGIIHVRLADNRINYIHNCDMLRRTAQIRLCEHDEARSLFAPTTLERRIMTLLKPHLIPTAGTCAISVLTLQLVTTQLHQLVSEYVVRGRVYVLLFAKQEREMNSRSLSPTTALSAAARLSAPVSGEDTCVPPQRAARSQKSSSGTSQREGGVQRPTQTSARRSDAILHQPQGPCLPDATATSRSAESARITKHAHLSPVYGKQFQHHHYVFSSFAPEDHAILVFLGSA